MSEALALLRERKQLLLIRLRECQAQIDRVQNEIASTLEPEPKPEPEPELELEFCVDLYLIDQPGNEVTVTWNLSQSGGYYFGGTAHG